MAQYCHRLRSISGSLIAAAGSVLAGMMGVVSSKLSGGSWTLKKCMILDVIFGRVSIAVVSNVAFLKRRDTGHWS